MFLLNMQTQNHEIDTLEKNQNSKQFPSWTQTTRNLTIRMNDKKILMS